MSKTMLDARNLLCPMPVIKLQNKVAELKAGAEVLLLATDPGVQEDIPAWCRINGHEVIAMQQQAHEFHIRVLVKDED